MGKIVIIDDDRSFGDTLEIFLSEQNYKVFRAAEPQKGLSLIRTEFPDLVVTDLVFPSMKGIEILKEIKIFDPQIQVIIVTAFDTMESTIEAMQAGAYDFIEKSSGMEKIRSAIRQALESKKLSQHLHMSFDSNTEDIIGPKNLVGKTPLMNDIFKKIGKVSSNKVNVLIQGESGTGKELIAKIIHFSGVTKNHPFIAVNCSALMESLLESELFGHEKGSFTGAERDKKGKFELAEEGTLFLDEISELSLHLQVKLLRVIQEKEFERVGGENSIPMKARIISATNQDLSKLSAEGKFREDLFYRLNVFTIDVPSLRQRKEDIPLLVAHLLKKINKELNKNVSKIPNDVMEILQQHNWIGNVRELENVLLQGVVLSKGDVLEKECIILNEHQNKKPTIDQDLTTLAEIEKYHIERILAAVNWNKKEASQILGIAKTTLYNKIDLYQLKEPNK